MSNKKLDSRDVFEYLIKQGVPLSNDDWVTLNLDGFLPLELPLTTVNWINKNTKVVATRKSLNVSRSGGTV